MAQSILEESRKAKKKGIIGIIFNKKTIIIAVIILIAAGGAYYVYAQNTKSKTVVAAPQQWTVKKEDLKIAVQETGNVVTKNQVSLSFPVSGSLEVNNVYVKEGDKVKQGDKIASVKTDTLDLALRSAYASYQSALDNLNSKEAPPTDSNINSAKAAISQAQIALDQANLSLAQTTSSANQSVANAQSTVDSAQNNLQLNSDVNNSAIVNNAYADLVNALRPVSVTLQNSLQDSETVLGLDNTAVNASFKSLLGVVNPNSLNAADASYTNVKNLTAALDASLATLNSSSSESAIDGVAAQAQQALNALQSHLYDMQTMLNATVVGSSLSQTQLDSFQSTNSADRSAVNSALSSLSGSIQAVANAKNNLSGIQISYNTAVNNLNVAKAQASQNITNAQISVKSKQLALMQAQTAYTDLIAPPRPVDIASAQTALTSAAIQVSQAQYNVSQATLTAPIDGVVSLLNYKVGDIILNSNSTTDNTVATIINTNTLYIEANVQEADVSKLKVGDKADVTFDAIDGLQLEGQISYISLTSTTSSNGIVTYLVRVMINNSATSPVREGMTATINFITAEASNVLAVPVAAVRNVNNQPSVQMTSGQFVPVVTGFTDGTDVEIISGLKAGDVIQY